MLTVDDGTPASHCLMLGWSDDLEWATQVNGIAAHLGLDELRLTRGACVYLRNSIDVKTTPNVAAKIGVLSGDRTGLVKVETNQMLWVSSNHPRTEVDSSIVLSR